MKKIYIAGALNAPACQYVQNLHRIIATANEVRRAGFAVFVPGIDILMGLVDGNFNYEDYFDNSQPWLKSSDALFLAPGWQDSKGVKREIELAKSLFIPVISDLDELIKIK